MRPIPPADPECASEPLPDEPPSATADAERSFLSRWARRKEMAQRKGMAPGVDVVSPVRPPHEIAQSASAPGRDGAVPPISGSGAESRADPQVELPKLEEITAETDVTGFLTRGVTDAIRNAALRRVWTLDPAIRDYVGDARDYGYDWNVPGGVPGFGAIDPAYDVQGMLAGLFSRGEPEVILQGEAEGKDEREDEGPPPADPVPHQASPQGLEAAGDVAAIENPERARGEHRAEGQVAPTRFPADSPGTSVEIARRHGRATPV